MIWVFFALITAAVLALVLWPLLRKSVPTHDRASYDLTVFQDQLKEVERDVERGVLTEDEAGAARLEIQRRILGAGRAPTHAESKDSRKLRIVTAVAVAIAVPAVAAVLYLKVGAPNLTTPGTLVAQGGGEGRMTDAQIDKIVRDLADKVAADPTNLEGLELLSHTYRQLGRYADAANVYKQLVKVKPDADSYASLGEAMMAAAQGKVSPEAHDALMTALSFDRNEPRARFYMGLEEVNKGDAKAAIAIWRDLTATAPPDAPWLPMVRERMGAVAQEAGIAPMSVEPKHPSDMYPAVKVAQAPAMPLAPRPAPPAAPPGPPGGMSPEQLKMIEGMVGGLAARLESNPKDYDGWMMLGRSYTILRNADGAKKAYETAIALKPTEVDPRLQYMSSLMTTITPGGPLPKTAVDVAGDILKLDAAQPEALYVSGLARAQAGDKAGARAMWTKAHAALADDSPLKAEIAQRLGGLQ